MINSWHCDNIYSVDVPPVFTGDDCYVTSSSTVSTTVSTSTVPYGDWLLINSLILFMVAFIPVTALFSLIKKR